MWGREGEQCLLQFRSASHPNAILSRRSPFSIYPSPLYIKDSTVCLNNPSAMRGGAVIANSQEGRKKKKKGHDCAARREMDIPPPLPPPPTSTTLNEHSGIFNSSRLGGGGLLLLPLSRQEDLVGASAGKNSLSLSLTLHDIPCV